MVKRKQEPETANYCVDCAHATVNTKFENLSVDGKPTLLNCNLHTERRRLIDEKACKDFRHFNDTIN